ncbi:MULTISPECIES: AAA family ATPase [Pectobacterium]|uniref:AAA family ATPase n=1 Tax=Pectobacterium TaxID=122277 RepID=UPI0018DAD09A|nr:MULTISPECIES: AAA family ATPase [Pectobacterium]QPI41609.1 AAA family ATPase [Pectobacterium aroidearum]
MRITKISLTNFRSFKETQTIDIAPVTLLFGPNSVGKSSILMALAYVQQILKQGHCNPQKLDALGNKTIGGFRALVHGQDLTKTIRIRLDYSPDKTPFVYYGSDVDAMTNHIQYAHYVLMNDFGGSIESGTVEFEIAWSERFKRAYVKNYRVWANDVYVGCVNSSEDLKNTLVQELNTQHPLLIPYNNEDWLESEYGEAEGREPLELDEYHTEFEQVLNQLNPNPASTATVADKDNSGTDFVNRIAPIALACRSGAIPLLGTPVVTNLSGQDFDEFDEHFNFLVVQEILSQVFVLPLDMLMKYLSKSVQIGPIRLVPDNDYVPNPHPEQRDWVDGSAAWDLLYKDPNSDSTIRKLLGSTSDWFASSNKLDAGYEIINRSIAESTNIDSTDEHMGLLNKRHVFFRELRSNILLSANQLGTGISQVLPIVVAANYDDIALISVEQPELHIHPRIQVEIAEVFLHAKDKHSFLIETHSEHLILRLLKRIRQTTDNELPDGSKPIRGEDVSIIYLEPTENGVLTKRICVDEDGEFVERWPQGFFVERREELI